MMLGLTNRARQGNQLRVGRDGEREREEREETETRWEQESKT